MTGPFLKLSFSQIEKKIKSYQFETSIIRKNFEHIHQENGLMVLF